MPALQSSHCRRNCALAAAGAIALLMSLLVGCSDRNPHRSPASTTAPEGKAATASASSSPGTTRDVRCGGTDLESYYRSRGLVQLTITPTAPRSGDRVTVTGARITEPGRYAVAVSDLEEIEVKVAEVDVSSDRLIMATFVMPTLEEKYSGNPVGPCLAVTVLAATQRGERFISPLFHRP